MDPLDIRNKYLPSSSPTPPPEKKPNIVERFLAKIPTFFADIASFFNRMILGLKGTFFKARTLSEEEMNQPSIQKTQNAFSRFLNSMSLRRSSSASSVSISTDSGSSSPLIDQTIESMSFKDFNRLPSNSPLFQNAEFKTFYREAKTFNTFDMTPKQGAKFKEFFERVNTSSLSTIEQRKLVALAVLNSMPSDKIIKFDSKDPVVKSALESALYTRSEVEYTNLFRSLAFSENPKEFFHYEFGDKLLVAKDIIVGKSSQEDVVAASERFRSLVQEKVNESKSYKALTGDEKTELTENLLKLLDPIITPILNPETNMWNEYSPGFKPVNAMGYILGSNDLYSMIAPPYTTKTDRISLDDQSSATCHLDLEKKTIKWTYKAFSQPLTSENKPKPIFDEGVMFERTIALDFSKGFTADTIKILDLSLHLKKMSLSEYGEMIRKTTTQELSETEDFVTLPKETKKTIFRI